MPRTRDRCAEHAALDSASRDSPRIIDHPEVQTSLLGAITHHATWMPCVISGRTARTEQRAAGWTTLLRDTCFELQHSKPEPPRGHPLRTDLQTVERASCSVLAATRCGGHPMVSKAGSWSAFWGMVELPLLRGRAVRFPTRDEFGCRRAFDVVPKHTATKEM